MSRWPVMGSPSLILVTVFTVSVDVAAGRSCVKVEVGLPLLCRLKQH